MRELDNTTFEQAISGDKPAVIDFWAGWCMPCRMLAPVISEIADELEGKADFCKLNIDENPELAAKYGITSIPTIIMFNNGEEVNRMIGLKQKPQLKKEIESHLS